MSAVQAAHPDLIVDVGDVNAGYAALADQVQQATGTPHVLLDGHLARSPALLRDLGELTGDQDRATMLADMAETILTDVAQRLGAEPDWPRVYYGRGDGGLQTGPEGSINTEILELAGGRNVVPASGEALRTVTPDEILAWHPDVIASQYPVLGPMILVDPRWRALLARGPVGIVVAPAVPFGWFKGPPGVNRLIGLRWLARQLHPDLFPEDMAPIVRDFYASFYRVDLTPAQLDRLLLGMHAP